jgi:hypothetical protein
VLVLPPARGGDDLRSRRPAAHRCRSARAARSLQFRLGIADFLVCRACAVYVAATMTMDGGAIGVVNVNTLDDRESFVWRAAPMNYGAEKVEDRERRRARVWTPADVRTRAT